MTTNSQSTSKNPKNRNNQKLLEAIFNHFLSLVMPLIGLTIYMLIGQPLTLTPLLIFFPIIAFNTWKGGFSAGIVSTIVSALLIGYYFLGGRSTIEILNPVRVFQSLLILGEGMVLCSIVERGKRQEKIRGYKIRERELNKKLLEIELQNKKYEKEIRSRDEFLSIASHELKTPLTSMLLQTQSALHNIRNVSVAHFSFDKLLKMLESVENQTKRLSRMINDLLAVSVITVGHLNLEYEEINLGKLVKGVLTDFQARIEKENIQVIFNSEEDIIGDWDKIRIEQAISNFISNAIKYGLHNLIEINVSKQKKLAIFSIRDNGIGISQQKQKLIFELFQRAVSPEDYKGLGVGLYITQKIVNAHGGTVEVWSKPKRGSRFTMKLPLKPPVQAG